MIFKKLNFLGKQREPFLFITDFKAQHVKVYPLSKIEKEDIEFQIDAAFSSDSHAAIMQKFPIDFAEYKQKFDFVIEKIKSGDTYLLNLTQPTKIALDYDLKNIYKLSNAHYKLRYKDEFVCFSPETFVQIEDGKIHTYPMKGTIDASIPDASEKILQNEKETAEHIMVVDLLRNDLSMVATNVRVEKFRYITKIDTSEKSLLQVSSHISGDMQQNWHEHIGDIFRAILPAGSISGTPKKSTLEIIEEVEGYERGFYSGVFGIYDGKKLDSGIMIRFIQKSQNGLYYKSGGGITLDSDAQAEYEELIDKVYLP